MIQNKCVTKCFLHCVITPVSNPLDLTMNSSQQHASGSTKIMTHPRLGYETLKPLSCNIMSCLSSWWGKVLRIWPDNSQQGPPANRTQILSELGSASFLNPSWDSRSWAEISLIPLWNSEVEDTAKLRLKFLKYRDCDFVNVGALSCNIWV